MTKIQTNRRMLKAKKAIHKTSRRKDRKLYIKQKEEKTERIVLQKRWAREQQRKIWVEKKLLKINPEIFQPGVFRWKIFSFLIRW